MWHNQHSNGRSVLCVWRCCNIFHLSVKIRPHTSHLLKVGGFLGLTTGSLFGRSIRCSVCADNSVSICCLSWTKLSAVGSTFVASAIELFSGGSHPPICLCTCNSATKQKKREHLAHLLSNLFRRCFRRLGGVLNLKSRNCFQFLCRKNRMPNWYSHSLSKAKRTTE